MRKKSGKKKRKCESIIIIKKNPKQLCPAHLAGKMSTGSAILSHK